jgi:hypothetical protein
LNLGSEHQPDGNPSFLPTLSTTDAAKAHWFVHAATR